MTSGDEHQAVVALPDAVEEFLISIESKSSSVAHFRLLKAARSPEPLAAMSAQLAALANEIIDEA